MAASKTVIKTRLEFWQNNLDELQTAYLTLLKGGVKSYKAYDREFTKYDLNTLTKLIEQAEEKVDELTAQLEGGSRRKMVAVVPRDW